MPKITRLENQVVLAIANGAALSGAFDMRGFAGGFVLKPATWTDANIGFHISDQEAGTYVIASDDEGTPIQISGISTSVAHAYEIPPALFGAHWVKLWSKNTTAATETDNNQGGARALTVILKG